MKKWLLILLILISFNTTGCVAGMTKNAVDSAGDQVRLKWSEEWKPALLSEIKDTVSEGKQAAINQALASLEKYKADNNAKLTSIGVKIEDFDTNKDGKMSTSENLLMLKEIKKKNDESPNPLEWWQILAAVAAAYVPLTGAKELARKKMGKTA